MTDTFILRSDPDGLRAHGIPYNPAYAARLARKGKFAPLTYIGPHKSGWFLSQLQAFVASKRQAA